MFAVAALLPEAVERLISGRPQRMIVGPDHRAETEIVETAQAARMRLALFEKPDAEAMPAEVLAQHRFCAIENSIGIVAVVRERLLKAGLLKLHRNSSGRSDHFSIRKRYHDNCFGAADVGVQVIAFVFHGAIVEVWKVPEHFNSKPGDVVDVLVELDAAEAANGQFWCQHDYFCSVISVESWFRYEQKPGVAGLYSRL